MSVNTLPYNPALLQDVANAVQGYLPTTGITSINTPDNNLVATIAGNVADISLASNITVVDTVNTSNLVVSTFVNPFTTQPTVNGQVLSSDTAGVLSWATPVDTGITTIGNPDGNLSVSVAGTNADISLASNITVVDTVNTSNLVVSSFVNPFTTQPTVSGQILSSDTAGALSWITPGSTSLTGLLKLFYQSNGNQTATTTNASITIWNNAFTTLDITKQYVVRVNASWYLPATGVVGSGSVVLNHGATNQTYNVGYSLTLNYLYFSFTFDAYTPLSANETWSFVANIVAGDLQVDTDAYFNVEINEVQL
jgi:hypothetical protein